MRKQLLCCLSLLAFSLTMNAALPGDNPTERKTVNLNEDKGVLMYGATMLDATGPAHYVKFYSKNGYGLTQIAEVDPDDDGTW